LRSSNTTAALTLAPVACSIEYLFRRGARQFEWNVPSFPDGSQHFNSFYWRLLFVFGAWLALGGAKGCRSIPHITDPSAFRDRSSDSCSRDDDGYPANNRLLYFASESFSRLSVTSQG